MQSIRGVVFDFYGTLVEEAEDELRADREIFLRHGYPLSEHLRRSWIDPVSDLEHVSSSADRDSYLGLQRTLLRDCLLSEGISPADLEDLVDIGVERHRTRRMVVLRGVADTMSAMREAGIRTAVCSNWGWDLADKVEECGLSHLVDLVVTSAQAGYRKPHSRIFEFVLDRIAVDASEALFVGDTWSADIEGALSAGLSAALVEREEGPGPPGPYSGPVLRIRQLQELLPVLGLPVGSAAD